MKMFKNRMSLGKSTTIKSFVDLIEADENRNGEIVKFTGKYSINEHSLVFEIGDKPVIEEIMLEITQKIVGVRNIYCPDDGCIDDIREVLSKYFR